MKFGVDYRWLAPFSSPFFYRTFVQFSGVTAAPGGALSGTAAFAQPAVFAPSALLSKNFSLYGQDTWRITPRFTLTYGLRWDVNPAPEGKNSANDPVTVTGLNNPPTIASRPVALRSTRQPMETWRLDWELHINLRRHRIGAPCCGQALESFTIWARAGSEERLPSFRTVPPRVLCWSHFRLVRRMLRLHRLPAVHLLTRYL